MSTKLPTSPFADISMTLTRIVDISVGEAKASLREVPQSSKEQDKDGRAILPCGLNMVDLETRDFKIIGSLVRRTNKLFHLFKIPRSQALGLAGENMEALTKTKEA